MPERSIMFTREQLLVVAKSNPEVLVDIILSLQEQVELLTQRVAKLEKQISKNSRITVANLLLQMDSRSPQVKRKPKVFAKKQVKNKVGKKAIRATTWKKQNNLITLFPLHLHHALAESTTWKMYLSVVMIVARCLNYQSPN